ncbi:MAG: SpoIID/LytB domain-containing protein [Elusimicrobiaceae bacterium]|nr:SpoIID/LytB domain-containing protein [Elusimicrobiaceae bacterium]
MKKIILLLAIFSCAAFVHAAQTVRVQLAENLKSAQIKTSGKVYIQALNSTKRYKVSKSDTLNAWIVSKGKIQLGALTTGSPIIITPSSGVQLTFQKNTYTGKLYLIPSGSTLSVVEHTDLENYLLGVLPYEMSHTWPLEALKAQAVAARTYTKMQLKEDKSDFDLYNDVRSQMYKGSGKVYDSVRKAVTATRGQVLTYKDNLFNTYYHANCGGATDDAKIWTGSKEPTIKPLQGVSCKTDSHSKSYSWNATVPLKSINSFVNQNGLSGSVKKIKIAERTRTKRAVTLQFTTAKGSKTLSCAKFRLAVGPSLLKSCKITSISAKSSGFAFAGNGYGHGIGMCQDGAKGMAEKGKNYKQILAHYFPSSDLKTL